MNKPLLPCSLWIGSRSRNITHEIVSITYDVLATARPSYLSSILTIQPARSTRSSRLLTLYRPAVTSSRIILNRSVRYSPLILRNSLPPAKFRWQRVAHRSTLRVKRDDATSERLQLQIDKYLLTFFGIKHNANPMNILLHVQCVHKVVRSFDLVGGWKVAANNRILTRYFKTLTCCSNCHRFVTCLLYSSNIAKTKTRKV